MRLRAWRWVALLVLAVCSARAHAGLDLEFAELDFAAGRAQGVVVALPDAGQRAGRLHVARLQIGAQRWGPLTLDCATLSLTDGIVACRGGRLSGLPGVGPVRVSFSYNTAASTGVARLVFADGGRVDVRLGRGGGYRLDLTRVALARLLPFVPALAPWQPAALLDGTLRGDARGLRVALELTEGRFSDADGLHAGEALAGQLSGALRFEPGGRASWQAELRWHTGDVFWTPVLVSPELSVRARGDADAQHIRVASAQLTAPGVSGLTASGVFTRTPLALREGTARLQRGELAELVPRFVLPLVVPAQLARWRVAGAASGMVRWADGGLQSARLTLDEAGFSYLGQRFRVGPMSGVVEWARTGPMPARLQVDGLHWQKLDFKPFALAAEVHGDTLTLAPARLPVLDGAIIIEALTLAREDSAWQGRGSFYMEPVSMGLLTDALDLPSMAGTLSAAIPGVTVSPRRIGLDGALVIAVFDGYVQATELEVTDAFGVLPRLTAEVEAAHLDLRQLTETFSFGAVSGFVDARVKGLEMAAWVPVRFDASVRSSPGNYPRRISQRAVEHITALGGAGAMAAVQRSFLRFFNDFGYRELGLSCRLRNDVCEMRGLGDNEAPGAPFMVVRGGGIPALNVIGYNRRVDWKELVERITRVTAGNATPIVQ